MDLLTDRLRLQSWQVTDLSPFAALNAGSEVMAFFPPLLAREHGDAMAEHCQSLIDTPGWGFWAVERLAEGEDFDHPALPATSPLRPQRRFRITQHAWVPNASFLAHDRCGGDQLVEQRG